MAIKGAENLDARNQRRLREGQRASSFPERASVATYYKASEDDRFVLDEAALGRPSYPRGQADLKRLSERSQAVADAVAHSWKAYRSACSWQAASRERPASAPSPKSFSLGT